MRYTHAQIEELAVKLKSKPEKAPEQRSMNKSEAIRKLSSEILELQSKGYTLDEIAETLKGGGLEISTATLKSYMARAKTTNRTRSKGRTNRSVEGVTESKKEKKRTAGEKAAEIAASKKRETQTSGTFVATPDTRDI